jgi:HEAT repeat protein
MMKPFFLLLSVLAMFLATGTLSAQYQRSTIDVPDDLKIPEGALPKLREAFFRTQDWDGQVRLVVTISRVTNDDLKKYDLLSEIATWDVNGGIGATNTSTFARVIAISNLGISKSVTYIPGLLSILNSDKLKDTRIEAAKALSLIGVAADDVNRMNIVTRLIELLNDPQKYNFLNFNRADRQDKFFNDDIVAESIVNTLGDIGDPKCFGALLNIVNQQNHRDETIQAAWLAMKRIRWY